MSETTATRVAVRSLTHPAAVVGLVVLALNDHVLKDAYPGPVTGKLSDFAGLVFFPLLLATAVGLIVAAVPPGALGLGGLMSIWSKLDQHNPSVTIRTGVLTTVAVVVGIAAAYVPFLAWSGGLIAHWRPAVALSAAILLGAFVVMLRVVYATDQSESGMSNDQSSTRSTTS